MTGLPFIETKGNDVSAYIPTNVISITDGQIFLQSDLFNANQRPAIDVGISVSRVGGAAQTKAIKGISGTLKLDLAQYRSMQAFAMFASDLDQASRNQLARGARLVELLKQPQYTPYSLEEQVVSIWAGTTGQLDSVEVADISRFERQFLEYVKRQHGGVMDGIRETKQFSDGAKDELKKAIDAFKPQFDSSDDGSAVPADGDEGQTDPDDITQERITTTKGGATAARH
jgi:F-type H+-transporting ATPase subunit alpha